MATFSLCRPQAALTSCSGCALHEAAVQGPQGGHHGPSASPALLSAAVLFASLLVLVEEKETGVFVSSTLGFEYFNPTCVPFKSHGDAPASCFRRSSLSLPGDSLWGGKKYQVTETFDEHKEAIPIKKEKMGVFHR